jgi:hypothetical protein
MQSFFRPQLLLTVAPLLLLSVLNAEANGARAKTAASTGPADPPEPRVTMNAWTVGLAG